MCFILVINLLYKLLMSADKPESLLSSLSNISNHFEVKIYYGNDFFKDSLLGGCEPKG